MRSESYLFISDFLVNIYAERDNVFDFTTRFHSNTMDSWPQEISNRNRKTMHSNSPIFSTIFLKKARMKMDKIMQIKLETINFIGSSGGFCWLRSASLVPEVSTPVSKEMVCLGKTLPLRSVEYPL